MDEAVAEASFRVAKAFRYWRALSESSPTMDESALAWSILTEADKGYIEAIEPYKSGAGPCEGCPPDEDAIRAAGTHTHDHPEGVHP